MLLAIQMLWLPDYNALQLLRMLSIVSLYSKMVMIKRRSSLFSVSAGIFDLGGGVKFLDEVLSAVWTCLHSGPLDVR